MRRTGFTFIELIISITIFTIVIVAVYGVFYMGMKSWRRAEEEKSLQRIRLAFLKMEKELKKTFFFSGIKFRGSSEEMSFPLVVSGEERDEIYTVVYSVDRDEETGLSWILRKQGQEDGTIMTPSISSIKFEYAHKGEILEWRDSWNPDTEGALPSGVKISLEDEEVFSKTIFLRQPDLKI